MVWEKKRVAHRDRARGKRYENLSRSIEVKRPVGSYHFRFSKASLTAFLISLE